MRSDGSRNRDAKNEPATGIDPALVKALAKVLSDMDLTEIEVEHGALKIRVARALPAQMVHVSAPAPTHPGTAMHQPAPAAALAPVASAAPQASAGEPSAARAGELTAPMVGTAYLAAEPGAAPFIRVGDSVVEGQTVAIIEAMKVMNQIAAPRAGRVTEIFIKDGQPVEFGQALMVIA